MLQGFDLARGEADALAGQLAEKVSSKLENHVREAALTRLSRMKDRWGGAGRGPLLTHAGRLRRPYAQRLAAHPGLAALIWQYVHRLGGNGG